jgi:hypothetical protein
MPTPLDRALNSKVSLVAHGLHPEHFLLRFGVSANISLLSEILVCIWYFVQFLGLDSVSTNRELSRLSSYWFYYESSGWFFRIHITRFISNKDIILTNLPSTEFLPRYMPRIPDLWAAISMQYTQLTPAAFTGIVTAVAVWSIWGQDMFPKESDPTGSKCPFHQQEPIADLM